MKGNKMVKKMVRVLGVAIVLLVAASRTWGATPKYAFLFIGDGMSTSQRMIADEFSRAAGKGSLAMNTMPYCALTRTASASSLVTDSSAAATAIACGTKTTNGFVGVDPMTNKVTSFAVAAQKAGKKVGILTSVMVTHATPAGFYAHNASRQAGYEIALDLADSGFDLFAGGGLDHTFDNTNSTAYVGDAYENARRKGYRVVTSKQEFEGLRRGSGKVLTRFTDGALPYAIDAKVHPEMPTLAEVVAKAIELLDGEEGFFIMCEGGRIDWAGHANDAGANLHDVLALDEAVKVALKFQAEHPAETLIVVTGDHETGGMSMGSAATGYAMYLDRLARQTVSADWFAEKCWEAKNDWEAKKENQGKRFTFEGLTPMIESCYGLVFDAARAGKDPLYVTPEEAKPVQAAFALGYPQAPPRIAEACKELFSQKCGIGWTTRAHTGMPVPTTAVGCGAEKFSGYIDNTDIAKIFKEFYGASGLK